MLGQFVGAMPGSSHEMTIDIAIPFTLVFTPLSAIGFLFGIGIGIGIVPGIGSTATAFMSYASTKQAAKDAESFGAADPDHSP